MLWIALADDASHALPFGDPAVLTDRLNAAANFHVLLPTMLERGPGGPPLFSELAFEITHAGPSRQASEPGQSVTAREVRFGVEIRPIFRASTEPKQGAESPAAVWPGAFPEAYHTPS